MRKLTAQQQQDLNQALYNAALASAWTQSDLFNGMGTTQNLSDVTLVDNEADLAHLQEHLDHLELFEAFGADLLISLIPLAATSLGLQAYFYKDRKTANLLTLNCLNATASKTLTYASLKAILSFVVLQGITVTNPLAHIGLAVGFAFFYSIISSGLQLSGEYMIKRPSALRKDCYDLEFQSFTAFCTAPKQKQRIATLLVTNFCAGLALYGSSLIPGLSPVASLFTTGAIVGATTGTATLFCRKFTRGPSNNGEYVDPENRGSTNLRDSNPFSTKPLIYNGT